MFSLHFRYIYFFIIFRCFFVVLISHPPLSLLLFFWTTFPCRYSSPTIRSFSPQLHLPSHRLAPLTLLRCLFPFPHFPIGSFTSYFIIHLISIFHFPIAHHHLSSPHVHIISFPPYTPPHNAPLFLHPFTDISTSLYYPLLLRQLFFLPVILFSSLYLLLRSINAPLTPCPLPRSSLLFGFAHTEGYFGGV